MTRSAKDDNVQDMLDIAAANGWTIRTTVRGHLQLRPPDPDKPLVVVTHKRGDPRAFRNARAQLKRAGLPV
jgi:hypothetical protein